MMFEVVFHPNTACLSISAVINVKHIPGGGIGTGHLEFLWIETLGLLESVKNVWVWGWQHNAWSEPIWGRRTRSLLKSSHKSSMTSKMLRHLRRLAATFKEPTKAVVWFITSPIPPSIHTHTIMYLIETGLLPKESLKSTWTGRWWPSGQESIVTSAPRC